MAKGRWVVLSGLTVLALACNLTTMGTCYVQEPTTLTGAGSVSFVSPTASATSSVSSLSLGVGSASPIGYFDLSVTQSRTNPGNVSLTLFSYAGKPLAGFGVTPLPAPGTYSLRDVGSVTTCPSADALADGGADASGSKADAGCGPLGGTLVVTTNSAGPCHPSAGTAQPPTSACPTEFAGTLTFSVSDTPGTTTLSGSLSFDFQQPVRTYSCKGSD